MDTGETLLGGTCGFPRRVGGPPPHDDSPPHRLVACVSGYPHGEGTGRGLAPSRTMWRSPPVDEILKSPSLTPSAWGPAIGRGFLRSLSGPTELPSVYVMGKKGDTGGEHHSPEVAGVSSHGSPNVESDSPIPGHSSGRGVGTASDAFKGVKMSRFMDPTLPSLRT